MLTFEIKLNPVTKKNHGRIVKGKGGRRFLLPSEAYTRYQKDCKLFMPRTTEPINAPVNIKAVYYMGTKRKVDLVNLHSTLHDVLTHYGIIADDHAGIIWSTDGSYVSYDKENPRTEVCITEVRGCADAG